MDLTLNFDGNGSIAAICGQNNVGKTNTLRAINIFFNPNDYDHTVDMPNYKLATRGGSVYAEITIDFFDDIDKKDYIISRIFANDKEGFCKEGYRIDDINKRKKIKMTIEDIESILARIKFFYIESINEIIPSVIKDITNDIIDVQYDTTRFTNSKKGLKEGYDNYVVGLQSILDSFALDISETFNSFRNNWDVKFLVPKNSLRFRDLISDEVQLSIDDKGAIGIENKGSGLQRLALILLQFEVITRLKKKFDTIICIDEPDIYLHEGLQKKLYEYLLEKSQKTQIIYTTHSKIFIDTYNMKNVFLLDARLGEKYSVRKGRDINTMETFVVDINDDNGLQKICEHLGINRTEYEPLDDINIIVEGGSDKKYLEELGKFFGCTPCNIISSNGADNIPIYLDFYASYYKTVGKKPKIKIILDNDRKGREVYYSLKKKTYQYMDIYLELITNFTGISNFEQQQNNTNHEIEDFIYPEIICLLANSFLEKVNMNPFNSEEVINLISKKAYSKEGILALMQSKKNENNPDDGDRISFVSSGNGTNQMKEAWAKNFNISGNKNLIRLIEDCNKKYPKVRENIIQFFKF